jgi:hypothetical protein
MIDSGSRSQVRPLESFKRSRFGLLAIASFIMHNLDWQAGNNFGSFAPYSDYPLTGLLPRNAPTGISRP